MAVGGVPALRATTPAGELYVSRDRPYRLLRVARAAGFLDLNDHGRVVSLSLDTQFVDPVDRHAIPFTELATIGEATS